MNRRALPLLLLAAGSVVAAPADPPARLLLFRSPGTVVTEGPQSATLAGDAATVAVLVRSGADAPDARLQLAGRERAARDLAEFLARRTSAKVIRLDPRAAADPEALHGVSWVFEVGMPDARARFPELPADSDQGFAIAAEQQDGRVWIRFGANGGEAHAFAVWFFLQNWCGVRILGMTEDMVVVPRGPLVLPVPLRAVVPAPAFQLRVNCGLEGVWQHRWLQDYASEERWHYHHNLYRIFAPGRFGATRPSYFPLRGGQRFIPPVDAVSDWQPPLSDPSVRRRAVEYADELFAAEPWARSLSLSVNDGFGYSEDDVRRAARGTNGALSLSGPYYDFVSAVARDVARTHPGRKVALLPYLWVRDPPSRPLPSNAVVFLFDEPKAELARWRGKAQHFGIYQWLYGWTWVFPNHWPHAMQAYLRWARAERIDLFKGESYAAWAADGPKLFVLNNLLWDPDQDVDALLADYWRHAYGAAAPHMEDFFSTAEAVYDRRPAGDLFRIAAWRPGAAQFADVQDDDMMRMENDLVRATAAVEPGSAEAKRVEALVRHFGWCLTWWRQEAALRRLRVPAVHSDEEILGDMEAFLSAPRAQREWFVQQVAPWAPLTVYAAEPGEPKPSQVDPACAWPDGDAVLASAAEILTRRHGQDHAAFWSGVASSRPALRPYVTSERLRMQDQPAQPRNMLADGSFDGGGGPKPAWSTGRIQLSGEWMEYHNRAIAAQVRIAPGSGRNGSAALHASGITDYTGALTLVTGPNHARYRLSFWYRTAPGTRGAYCAAKALPGITIDLAPHEQWTRCEVTFLADAEGGDLTHFFLILALRRGGSDGAAAWFDDVRLECLAPGS